jgi:hypothetical protein
MAMTITRRLLNALLSAVAAGLIAALAGAGVVGCIETPPDPRASPTVLIITLTPSARARLITPDAPDPTNTGLPSLDRLNRAWRVTHMTPVFPDVDPADPVAQRHGLTAVYRLTAAPLPLPRMMARAYAADPHVESVEIPGDIAIP